MTDFKTDCVAEALWQAHTGRPSNLVTHEAWTSMDEAQKRLWHVSAALLIQQSLQQVHDPAASPPEQ